MDGTVGIGRAVVESEARGVMACLHDLGIEPLSGPSLSAFGLVLRQVSAHREGSLGQVEAALVPRLALFLGLFFIGIAILPIAIYFVGTKVFGAFDGNGYSEFFGTLSGRIRSGDRGAWFLITSPYLAILTLRLMAWGWRSTSAARPQH